jgi:antitoxin YefM
MNGITSREAKLNLEGLLEQVVADAETLYLLSNPANADHLRRSIAEAKAGEVHERELLDV